jgi:hypothetical protein
MGAPRGTALVALAALLSLSGATLPARAGSTELDLSTVWDRSPTRT